MEITDEQRAAVQAEYQAAVEAGTDFANKYIAYVEEGTEDHMTPEEHDELRKLIVSSFMAGTNYITRRIGERILMKAQEQLMPADPKEIN
jgi:hypothetical protein